MLLLNYHTNVLINLILRTYFRDHRCLLVFLDTDVDHGAQFDIPVIMIRSNGSVDFNVIFHYFGCQGIVIHSKNATAIFAEFEARIRLNMERFNRRRFLILTSSEKKFFGLKELKFVSDILLISPPKVDSEDFVFDLKTHQYVGVENNSEPVLVDRWFSKNHTFLFWRELYPDKLKNQLGRTLSMATFTYQPYSIIGAAAKDRQGSELRTALEFASMLNMTPELVVNPEDYWGDIFPNGSGIGLLGNLAKDKADIGFSALYTWGFCYDYLDLSKPLVRTGITCLVPAPRLAARWLTPFFSYTPQLWLYVVILFVASIIILSLIFACYNSMERRKSHFFNFVGKATKIVLKPVVLQPLALSEIPWRLASKHVLALMLVLSLFLTSTYSSGLATIMTLPKYEDAINTLEDFVKSGLEWGGTQDGWILSIQTATEPAYIHIVSKFRAIPEEDKLRELTKTRQMAFSIERLPFENYAIGDYIGEDVIGNYHLMLEDFYWEQCVIMLRKNSVLLPSLDLFILKTFEAGLISKWQSLAVEKSMNTNVQRVVKYYRHHQQEKKVVKLKWSHVEGAFAVLAIGYAASLGVFLVELANKRKKKRHCKFVIVF